MPGQKGESGKTPSQTAKTGAYAHSANSFGEAETANMQGFNSMDGSQNKRGGQIRNSNAQYGKGGMKSGGDY